MMVLRSSATAASVWSVYLVSQDFEQHGAQPAGPLSQVHDSRGYRDPVAGPHWWAEILHSLPPSSKSG